MQRILLAGSTGYLGSYIAKELQKRSCFFRAIARDAEKLKQIDIEANEMLKAELTDPNSINECCKGIDKVAIIFFLLMLILKQEDRFNKNHFVPFLLAASDDRLQESPPFVPA